MRAADTLAAGDLAVHRELRKEHAFEQLPCPLLGDDGLCGVYDARPLSCRVSYVVDTAEHCAPSREPDAPAAQIVSHPGYERFMAVARRVVGGMQGAMGLSPRRREALPIAVAALMDNQDDGE